MMKYVPQIKDRANNHNVSKENPLRALLGLLVFISFGLLILLTVSYAGIEALVRLYPSSAVSLLTSITPSFDSENEPGSVEQDLLNRLVSIYDKMKPHLPLEARSYNFQVISSEEPNAFAHPNGTILFNSKTGEMLKSEIELAMIVAHELGHYHHEHHLKRISRIFAYITTSFVISAGFSSSNLFIDVALKSFLFSYTQDQEKEADFFGLDLVYNTYRNVEGVTTFFEKLSEYEIEWISSDLFSTHPGSKKRVQYLKERAGKMGYLKARIH